MTDPRSTPAELDERLIDTIFAGDASVADHARYEAWCNAHPVQARRLSAVRRVVSGAETASGAPAIPVYSPADAAVFAARARGVRPAGTQLPVAALQQAIGATSRPFAQRVAQRDTRASKSGFPRLRVLAAAAGIACTIACAAVVMYVASPRVAVRTAAPVDEYVTTPGQQRTIQLADGTVVRLNVASKLTVARGFGTSHRDVRLYGEALFEVRHDARAPFTVVTGPTRTTVLGTTFTVRAYEGDTWVAVRDGKVAVQPPNVIARHAAVVAPGQMVVVASSGTVRRGHGVDADLAFAWTRGRLVFRDTPVGDVLSELSRWTGLTLRVSDPALLRRPLTTSLSTHITEEELRAIADALDARVERVGQTVTFVSTR